MKAFGPRTVPIPTGDIETLDFELTVDQKRELYERGYRAAKAFFDAASRRRGARTMRIDANALGALPAGWTSR